MSYYIFGYEIKIRTRIKQWFIDVSRCMFFEWMNYKGLRCFHLLFFEISINDLDCF